MGARKGPIPIRRLAVPLTGLLILAGSAAAFDLNFTTERIHQTVGFIRGMQIEGRHIAWIEDQDTPQGSVSNIYLYDGLQIHRVTQPPLLYAVHSEIALEDGRVAWFAVNESDPPPEFGAWLYLWENGVNRKLGVVCRKQPVEGHLLEAALHEDELLFTSLGTDCSDPYRDVDLWRWKSGVYEEYVDTDYTDQEAWGEVSQVDEFAPAFINGEPQWSVWLTSSGLIVPGWAVGPDGENRMGRIPALSMSGYQLWGDGYAAWVEHERGSMWHSDVVGSIVFEDNQFQTRLPTWDGNPTPPILNGRSVIWRTSRGGANSPVYIHDRATQRRITWDHHTIHDAEKKMKGLDAEGERIVWSGMDWEEYVNFDPDVHAIVPQGVWLHIAGRTLPVVRTACCEPPPRDPQLSGPHIVWWQDNDATRDIFHTVEPANGRITVDSSHTYLTPGDHLRVRVEMACDPRPVKLDWIFSIEVAGIRYYYPDWGVEPVRHPVVTTPGREEAQSILDLIWPAGVGGMSGLAFHAQLLWHDSPFLVAEDSMSWGFGETAKGGER